MTAALKSQASGQTDESRPARILLLGDDKALTAQVEASLILSAGTLDCVQTAPQALRRLLEDTFDAVVCDLDTDESEGMRIARHVVNLVPPIPAVLVTGKPTIETALEAHQLPILAYLVKPVPSEDMTRTLVRAVGQSRVSRMTGAMQARLELASGELEKLRRQINSSAPISEPVTISAFVALTMESIVGGLTDLDALTRSIAQSSSKTNPCHLFDCPRPKLLAEAIHDAIETIEKTKSSFRSNELRDLRERLNNVLGSEKER